MGFASAGPNDSELCRFWKRPVATFIIRLHLILVLAKAVPRDDQSPKSSWRGAPQRSKRALIALDRIIGVDRIFAFYTGFAGFFAEVLDAGFGQLGHAVFGKLSPKGADHFGAE